MSDGRTVVFRLRAEVSLEEGVQDAFRHFRRFPDRSAVLIFSETHAPTASLTELLVSEVRTEPELRALYLVHPTRALGLVASSVSLAGGGIPVRSMHGIPELEAFLASGEVAAFRPSAPPRPHDVGSVQGTVSGMVVAACGDGAPEQVRVAFDRLRVAKARVGLLLFSPEATLPLGLRETLCRELAVSPDLCALALVHPGPAAGFLASSIGLELNTVVIEAHPSLASATELSKRVQPDEA